MVTFHIDQQADLTIASIRVPWEEASRYGVLTVDKKFRIKSFIEKPKNPTSNLINMGVYLFNRELLDRVLWEDHLLEDSSHDFGKDILPRLVKSKRRVIAYPFTGYWMDVGTILSYWQAHMDLLSQDPPLKLYDRSWVIHTRTAERPPVRIPQNASVYASMISDGCTIQENARVESSVLSPGVILRPGAVVRESIILSDAIIESGALVERAILDKRVHVEKNAHVGGGIASAEIKLVVVGKNSIIPTGVTVEPGATIGPDVVESDYSSQVVKSGEYLETKRQPYEI
jgi:glucose-1-phosphate adenylyltransferase